jgi:ACT domain
VGQLIRLRISLADRAGALAQAATIIGLHGGSIVSVDVQRTGGESAIDELIIDFPGEPDLADLGNDLLSHASAHLISQDPAEYADPIEAVLRRMTQQLEATDARPTEALAAEVAELCSAPVVWVSTREEAVRYDVGQTALDRNGPVCLRSSSLPEQFASRLSGEVSILAVPDADRGAAGRVVFVARSSHIDFTETEIARIRALIALHTQIERLLEASTTGDP